MYKNRVKEEILKWVEGGEGGFEEYKGYSLLLDMHR